MSPKRGYWIAMISVEDAENYKRYLAANAEPLAKYGARPLARGGRHENPEGASGDRHVVIEFDSFDQAVACYHSPEYQKAVKLRLAFSKGCFAIVEGV